MSKIIYTYTDEAPALATHSFLPIIKAFTSVSGVEVETRDISLAARILAIFPDKLNAAQKKSDDLAELGKLAKQPDANIIKLPNISASVPQLMAAIKELQGDGYPLPDYPEKPKTAAEKDIKKRYDSIKGSAVNPVLREGNSDRRAPQSVKNFAKKNPHKMGKWSANSKSHVSHMTHGDFYGSEKSIITDKATTVKFVFEDSKGKTSELRAPLDLEAGEVFDCAVASYKAMTDFFTDAIADAKKQGVLMSVHMKATMMKVSDPVIFGHAVRAYYKAVYDKHEKVFADLGISPNNGVGEIYSKLGELPEAKQQEIKADIDAVYKTQPPLAMVNSDKGITNLHVPSDVIIDASMPAAIRTSGQMWNADGELQDTKFCIPGRTYSRMYQVVIEDCIANGAYDPTTMAPYKTSA